MDTTASHHPLAEASRSPRRRLASVLVTALLLGLIGVVLPVSTVPAGAAPSSMESQFVALTNQARGQNGLGNLGLHDALSDQARAWAVHLAQTGALAHDPNIASETGQIIPNWQRIGENVGYGPSVQAIQDAFMNSAPHRANILGDYNIIGVGVAQSGNGTIWVTVRFVKADNVPTSTTVSPRGPGDAAGVYRGGNWYLRNSFSNGPVDKAFGFGLSGDVPVMGDWNGDGVDTPGVYRNGNWYLRNSNSNGPPDAVFGFGLPGDIPVVGDWNRDGVDTIGVFRDGMWYLRDFNSNGPPTYAFGYGWKGDIPVVGDWNRDGWDTIGVFRNGTWYLRDSASNGPVTYTFGFGFAGDTPVVGDWNGDGWVTMGVRRGSTYFLRNNCSNGPVDYQYDFGFSNDTPVTGAF